MDERPVPPGARADHAGGGALLSVSRRVDAGRSVLAVVGEIDEWTCSRVLLAVRQALLDSGDVVLDLSGVTFIGSAGLSALLQLQAHAERQRQRLEIVRVPAVVRRAIDLARLGDILRLDRDDRDASEPTDREPDVASDSEDEHDGNDAAEDAAR